MQSRIIIQTADNYNVEKNFFFVLFSNNPHQLSTFCCVNIKLIKSIVYVHILRTQLIGLLKLTCDFSG